MTLIRDPGERAGGAYCLQVTSQPSHAEIVSAYRPLVLGVHPAALQDDPAVTIVGAARAESVGHVNFRGGPVLVGGPSGTEGTSRFVPPRFEILDPWWRR